MQENLYSNVVLFFNPLLELNNCPIYIHIFCVPNQPSKIQIPQNHAITLSNEHTYV